MQDKNESLIFEYDVEGGDFDKAGTASSSIKKLLKQLNLNSKIIKRIVVALYEAEVNIVAHAYEGKITTEITEKEIVIILKDKGPGIEDIDKAMEVGFSTASEKVVSMGFGAGMGLPNIKRNSDYLNVDSTPGVGTTVTIKVNIA
jgi:serine/threonine-protein kinase RsbT